MESNIFIPKRINVGYQNRKGTYTGKLAYVIYYDESGKLRKEKSWNSWRDQSIPNDEFDNTPTEGFVLNKKVGDYSTGWNHRHSYCRVYDPRGFEFEISIENLLYILESANSIKGKGLEGEFIYGWDGKDLVFMPIESPDYKEISEYNKLVHNNEPIRAKDLIIGATYRTKDNEHWIYMGRFNEYENGYEWIENGEVKRSMYSSDVPVGRQSGRLMTIKHRKIHDFLYGKVYWFAKLINNEYKFQTLKSIPKNKFIDCINEKCTSEYSNIYDKLESNPYFSPIDDSKDKVLKMTYEEFHDRVNKYDAWLDFMSSDERKYNVCLSDIPEKYILYRYDNGHKHEVLNVFQTGTVTTKIGLERCTTIKEERHMFPVSLKEIFDVIEPVYKKKYLQNGREYKKEYIF